MAARTNILEKTVTGHLLVPLLAEYKRHISSRVSAPYLVHLQRLHPKSFAEGIVVKKESGVAFAARALAYGSLLSICGTGIFFWGIWKVSGAHDFEDFKQKVGQVLPRVTKKTPPKGRTEFEGLTDLLTYIIEQSEREDRAKKAAQQNVQKTKSGNTGNISSEKSLVKNKSFEGLTKIIELLLKSDRLPYGCIEFKVVQEEISEIIKGRILVGHAIKHDLKVLYLSHPKKYIRDTSIYKPFRKIFDGRTPSLKKLTATILSVNVQEGEHSPVEDARAAVRLYTMHRKEWENSLKKNKSEKKQTCEKTVKSSSNDRAIYVDSSSDSNE
ncbi:REXO4 [Lepeophtheirus salmonis]|uniref:REXO4 n=1 Tax=Lepeophtheirus salmonis TaxID=72036 RepID=A0A7R8CFC1_LEPSM|nr:REXO4 [Lepeophtheirus salmonis]CAF2759297.1 REXO4 [Lepeophtheirus salmonis]